MTPIRTWLAEADSSDPGVARLLMRLRAERELPADFSCYGAVRTFLLSRYGQQACDLAPDVWRSFMGWKMRNSAPTPAEGHSAPAPCASQGGGGHSTLGS